jgi:hypothetical protein
MNRRERKAAQGAMTVEKPGHPGELRAAVSYASGGPATITLAQLQFARAERAFPADCAIARMRLDSPELHFAQLDPYNDKRIVRAVVVRYDRDRFVERARANEPYRIQLAERLRADGRYPDPGSFGRRFEAASFEGDSITALIDAEFELASWSGGRAGMIFLIASQNELASVIVSRAEELYFNPELEVTMTTVLLADLFLSWKTLAESIQ